MSRVTTPTSAAATSVATAARCASVGCSASSPHTTSTTVSVVQMPGTASASAVAAGDSPRYQLPASHQ
ncbi:Uncharacterised protein [Mycobacteroides abscessus subsp. abscessus]|nr:Uncharacterised protein [Mycobacteroides abscessus subsp. abscessus]